MRIINTATARIADLDTIGQLALYSGMDCLTLYEINDGLDELLTPGKIQTYNFEMELQAPLLEMSFNGIFVDQGLRDDLTRAHEKELLQVHHSLHQLCLAIGYYDYYIDKACIRFAAHSGYEAAALPRSWPEWVALPVAERRSIKKGNEAAIIPYHKDLKEFGPPYVPGNRKEWTRKKNGAFNGNSPAQKLRLFYDFFGTPDNNNADPDFPPPWNKTRGISEVKVRNQKGEYEPSTNREALEKIQAIGHGDDQRDAAYWALPFTSCCQEISDYSKALGFLRCTLEKGYFKYSFGAVTDTGRLSSRANAQNYGSNAQNVAPRLRVVLCAEPGWKLATPDYEQIESRNVGAICFVRFGATNYLNASESGDLHSLTCSMVWDDLPWPEDFTIGWLEKHGPFPADLIWAAKKIAGEKFYRGKSRRDLSKTLGHAKNYRSTAREIARRAHIDPGLVNHYYSVDAEAYPEKEQWHTWVSAQLQTKGEITTMFGRTRRFFGRPNDDATLRKAIAYEPQSMAADYTNQALLRIHKAIQANEINAKLFLQKHDEIGVRYLEELEDLTVPRIVDIMVNSFTITAPDGTSRNWCVPVEALVGWNLGHASKSNPDGLTKYTGHDTRVRQGDPINILKRRI